jgi:hypothetical protein
MCAPFKLLKSRTLGGNFMHASHKPCEPKLDCRCIQSHQEEGMTKGKTKTLGLSPRFSLDYSSTRQVPASTAAHSQNLPEKACDTSRSSHSTLSWRTARGSRRKGIPCRGTQARRHLLVLVTCFLHPHVHWPIQTTFNLASSTTTADDKDVLDQGHLPHWSC